MQQVPAIRSLLLVDQTGTDAFGIELPHEPDWSRYRYVGGSRVRRARQGLASWTVHYEHDFEPYMRIAVAEPQPRRRSWLHNVNLELISISSPHQDRRHRACHCRRRYGRLVAHPDISLVLRGEPARRTSSG